MDAAVSVRGAIAIKVEGTTLTPACYQADEVMVKPSSTTTEGWRLKEMAPFPDGAIPFNGRNDLNA